MGTEMKKKVNKVNVVIAVLAVLLVGSLVALAIRTFATPKKSANPAVSQGVVEDNVIQEGKSTSSKSVESLPPEQTSQPERPDGDGVQTVNIQRSGSSGNGQAAKTVVELALNANAPQANHPFQVDNFLPGDVVEQSFSLKVRHNVSVNIGFRANLVEQTQNLGQVLQMKVVCTSTGETVYQGTMDGAASGEYLVSIPAASDGESVVDYTVQVTVDTSVDNRYQNANLQADFVWYAVEDSALTPPQTGDPANVLLWMVAFVSFGGLLVLTLRKGRERR